MNINGLSYGDSEQKFLNVLKEGGGNYQQNPWTTNKSGGSFETSEEQYLSGVLDSDGYPTTLTVPGIPGGQVFDNYLLLVQRSLSLPPGATQYYPAGTYRFKFIGQGTITFGFDVASLNSATGGGTINGKAITNASASTYVTVNVVVTTPSTSGIQLQITAISSNTDYPRDFSLVLSSNTAAYDSGQIFSPTYLSAIATSGATILRFMDVLNTNGQVAQYVGLGATQVLFSPAPSINDTTGVMTNVWPLYTGTYLITLKNGQSFSASFTANSTSVTYNGTVSSTCADGTCYVHAQKNWTDRPLLSNANYLSWKGAPLEIALQLCNSTNTNPWINVPLSFTSSDWASMCSLILSTLKTGLECYVEISNEVWNSGFVAWHYCGDVSPTVFSGTVDEASYYGRQVSLVADQFAATAGVPAFDNTFVFVMGGQAASTTPIVNALTTSSWTGHTAPWQRTSASGQKTIKRAAIAPYFGQGNIPSADYTHLTGLSDGGYTDFFASWQQNPVNAYSFTSDGTHALPAGGWFGLTNSWISSTVTALSAYGAIPLICYEGGWQFTGGAGQFTFLQAASRDARFSALYTAYFKNCLTSGAAIPAQYNFCSTYTSSGQWGTLENITQTFIPPASVPSKFQGVVNYTLGL